MADPTQWAQNSNPIDVSDELDGELEGDTYYFTGAADGGNADSGKVAIYSIDANNAGEYVISDVPSPIDD
jgi:hypothetical protein